MSVDLLLQWGHITHMYVCMAQALVARHDEFGSRLDAPPSVATCLDAEAKRQVSERGLEVEFSGVWALLREVLEVSG